MFQFNVKAILIATAWLAIVFTFARVLAFQFKIPDAYLGYAGVVFAGALAGTFYSVLRRRDERNRWLRAFVCGIFLGGLHLTWMNKNFTPMSVPASFLLSVIPAFVAATLTELLRMLLAKASPVNPQA